MFVLNEILVFTAGRRDEGIERLKGIHGLMAPHSGFKHAIVAKYLGDAARHTIMRFWEDEEAYQKFRESPDGNYGRNRPEGLYAGERVVSPWYSFGEVEGEATGDFVVKIQREVPEKAWDAFTTQQEGMRVMGSKIPGLVWARQLKAKDQNQALTVARFSNRAAFEQMMESPQYSESLKTMPEGVSIIRTECFEIESDVGPR